MAGKLGMINDGDVDYGGRGDGMPDYADGFNWFPGDERDDKMMDGQETDPTLHQFVPVKFALPARSASSNQRRAEKGTGILFEELHRLRLLLPALPRTASIPQRVLEVQELAALRTSAWRGTPYGSKAAQPHFRFPFSASVRLSPFSLPDRQSARDGCSRGGTSVKRAGCHP